MRSDNSSNDLKDNSSSRAELVDWSEHFELPYDNAQEVTLPYLCLSVYQDSPVIQDNFLGETRLPISALTAPSEAKAGIGFEGQFTGLWQGSSILSTSGAYFNSPGIILNEVRLDQPLNSLAETLAAIGGSAVTSNGAYVHLLPLIPPPVSKDSQNFPEHEYYSKNLAASDRRVSDSANKKPVPSLLVSVKFEPSPSISNRDILNSKMAESVDGTGFTNSLAHETGAMAALKVLFYRLDTDGNGFVSRSELRAVLMSQSAAPKATNASDKRKRASDNSRSDQRLSVGGINVLTSTDFFEWIKVSYLGCFIARLFKLCCWVIFLFLGCITC